ncbi:MAG: nitrile hydratase subunit alpha [Dehalococcoidia bacterium]
MAKYHPNVDDYVVSRVRALESLLIEKGVLAPEKIDGVVARYANDTGPLLGARMAAHAWLNPAYARTLADDSTAALREFGLTGYDELRVVADTPDVHNLVVCTLCSCYPWAVMGLPPVWYKMPPYRSRAVLEPRKLLAEMGWTIPESRELRVWDSSAELRYMVLPLPPAGCEGMSEDALAALVTRDALIGVEPVRAPA